MVEDTWRNLICFGFFIFNIFLFLFDIVVVGRETMNNCSSKSVIDNKCDTNDWMNKGMGN